MLVKKGTLRKSKYVIRVKDSLDEIVSELMEWHNLFDPSWFLIARAAGDDIDQKLKSRSGNQVINSLAGLRRSVQALNSAGSSSTRKISDRDFLGPRTPIASSSSTTAQLEGRTQYAIVDSMVVNVAMDPAKTTVNVIALSKALSKMEPFTFGLLRCCGVISSVDRYEFVFEIPQGLYTPQSLRALLGGPPPSLNVRLDIAKQLANSVLYLHATGFVHKNIRPDNILVFDRSEGRSSFLVGFENFRAAKDETFKTSDNLPERDLYRHPLRQGLDPEEKYTMHHDIYSLGVCLFEIGMWKSFVTSRDGRPVITFEPHPPIKDVRARGFTIKREILTAVNDGLPQRTGKRYRDVVERCITCLDDDTTWHQVDEKDDSEVNVGVEFIENVLLQLQEIVI